MKLVESYETAKQTAIDTALTEGGIFVVTPTDCSKFAVLNVKTEVEAMEPDAQRRTFQKVLFVTDGVKCREWGKVDV